MTERPKILNIVGDRKISPEESDQNLEVKGMFKPETIGYMPDIREYDFLKAIGETKKSYPHWRELSFSEKFDILEKAGREILGDDSLDAHIALAGGNPIKHVKEDRKAMAKFAMNSEGYLKHVVFHKEHVKHNLVEGKGTVGIAASSTVYSTQPWVILESLYGGNSVIIKLDGQEPFSGFQFGYHLHEHGAPVQIVSFSRDNGKSDWGRKMYKSTDSMAIMGAPQAFVDIAYHDLIRKLGGDRLAPNEMKEIMKNLPIPDKVVALISHGGLGYIDESADINKAIQGALKGATRDIRSCKRMRELVVHPKVYDKVLRDLQEAMAKLYIGDVIDYKTDVPLVSDSFWENNVDPYIKSARGGGEILFGEEEINQPKIIYNAPDSLLEQECTYAVISLKKGDFDWTLKICGKMADSQPKKRILELSIYSRDRGQIEYANTHAKAFNVHANEPTTEAIGKPHEGVYLARELSYIKGYKNNSSNIIKNLLSLFA
jgi:acyl-CoA reductase-like NAD-dependent aldehyde dehydrogenase